MFSLSVQTRIFISIEWISVFLKVRIHERPTDADEQWTEKELSDFSGCERELDITDYWRNESMDSSFSFSSFEWKRIVMLIIVNGRRRRRRFVAFLWISLFSSSWNKTRDVRLFLASPCSEQMFLDGRQRTVTMDDDGVKRTTSITSKSLLTEH